MSTLPIDFKVRLEAIIIELHNLGREVEGLKLGPLGMACALRALGDTTSELKSMAQTFEINPSNEVHH